MNELINLLEQVINQQNLITHSLVNVKANSIIGSFLLEENKKLIKDNQKEISFKLQKLKENLTNNTQDSIYGN